MFSKPQPKKEEENLSSGSDTETESEEDEDTVSAKISVKLLCITRYLSGVDRKSKSFAVHDQFVY
jgi:hypothetical protein